jgi:hypothetical protein
MILPEQIQAILSNENLDLADKICEIEKLLPKKEETEIVDILGNVCKVIRTKDCVTYDGNYISVRPKQLESASQGFLLSFGLKQIPHVGIKRKRN